MSRNSTVFREGRQAMFYWMLGRAGCWEVPKSPHFWFCKLPSSLTWLFLPFAYTGRFVFGSSLRRFGSKETTRISDLFLLESWLGSKNPWWKHKQLIYYQQNKPLIKENNLLGKYRYVLKKAGIPQKWGVFQHPVDMKIYNKQKYEASQACLFETFCTFLT